jgi:hypothetical protein
MVGLTDSILPDRLQALPCRQSGAEIPETPVTDLPSMIRFNKKDPDFGFNPDFALKMRKNLIRKKPSSRSLQVR